ncbi:MAG: hypothetical protein IPM24_12485 [Bryobacterales bacterium]|nr:hypothetical protein [Bryobacterales bacterium]
MQQIVNSPLCEIENDEQDGNLDPERLVAHRAQIERLAQVHKVQGTVEKGDQVDRCRAGQHPKVFAVENEIREVGPDAPPQNGPAFSRPETLQDHEC